MVWDAITAVSTLILTVTAIVTTRSHLKNGWVMLNEVKHLSRERVRRDSSIAPLFQNDTGGVFEMASKQAIHLYKESREPKVYILGTIRRHVHSQEDDSREPIKTPESGEGFIHSVQLKQVPLGIVEATVSNLGSFPVQIVSLTPDERKGPSNQVLGLLIPPHGSGDIKNLGVKTDSPNLPWNLYFYYGTSNQNLYCLSFSVVEGDLQNTFIIDTLSQKITYAESNQESSLLPSEDWGF